MIITRTPYRISFFGGGTDFPPYYEEFGGSVLSTTINRYSYIQCRLLPPFFDHNYRIRYFQTERVRNVEDIEHPSVRECLKYLDFPHPLEILHSGDIPAMSGIGSSSAFTVGFLMALHGLNGKMVTKRALAEQSIEVEQNRIKEHVGSQDQYAAAFGGFNRIDFGPGENIKVNPIILPPDRIQELQDNLLFCFSGIARFSSEIQEGHVQKLGNLHTELNEMKSLVDESYAILNSDRSLDEFGALLDTAWKIKKSFSRKVSNDTLDDLYQNAMQAGALGGKVCGAGGGGFMLFYVPKHARQSVEQALNKSLIVPMRFENLGAHTVFYTHEDTL